MAPKLPWKPAKVVSKAVTEGGRAFSPGPSSDAAKALAQFWTPGADDSVRAVSQDVVLGQGLDVSPPVDPYLSHQWRDQQKWNTGWSKNVPPLDTDVHKAEQEADRALDQGETLTGTQNALLSNANARETRGWREPPRLLGAAATVGAGALAFGATSAQAEEKLWTPEAVAKFKAKSKKEQDWILDQLTDAEFSELETAMKAAPNPATEPAKDAGYRPQNWDQYIPPLNQVDPGIGPFQPGNQPAPKPPLGEQIWSGLKEAATPQVGDLWNPVANPLRQVEAIVQPLKQTFLDPAIKAGQKAYRETDVAQEALAKLDERVGAGPAQAIRNVSSLFLGPPETYRTEQEQAAGQKALAQSAISTAQDVLGIAPEHRKQFAYPEQTGIGAFANTFTAEAAYLPLYRIDAPAKSGLVSRAAIGGGLSEALDPREGANPVRGMQFAGALGGAFDALARVPASVQKATDAVTWIRNLDLGGDLGLGDFKARAGVAVTPAEEVKKLVDAPAQGAVLPGGKPSFTQLDVEGEQFVSKPVVVQKPKHGGVPVKLEGKAKVGDPNPNAGEVVVASKRAVEKAKAEGKPLPKNVIVAEDVPPAVVTGPGDVAANQVLEASKLDVEAKIQELAQQIDAPPAMRDAETGRILIEDDAVPGLHQLPEKDTLVSFDNGTGRLEFQRLSAKEIAVKALEERRAVSVMTPDGPRLGLVRYSEGDKMLVAPFDAAEKMPGSITEPVIVARKDVTALVQDGKPLRELDDALKAREALLAREAEEAADAVNSQAAVAQAAAGGPVIDTPFGPQLHLNPSQGVAAPQPPPPVVNPNAAPPTTPLLVTGNGQVIAAAAPPAPPAGGLPPGGGGGPGGPPPGGPGPAMPPSNAPITPAMLAPPTPHTGKLMAVLQGLQQAGRRAIDLFIHPAGRGARGAIQSELDVVRLATAAGNLTSANTMESLLPRLLLNMETRIAPELAKMDPATKRNFLLDVKKTLLSKKATVGQLRQKYPGVAADMDRYIMDEKYRIERENDVLKNPALGWMGQAWVDQRGFTPPEGMQQRVDDILDDESYLAQVYLAQLAGPKEIAALFEKNKTEYARVVDMAAEDLLKEGKKSGKYNVTTTKADIINDAIIAVQKYLGDPGGILAKEPGGYKGTASQSARDMARGMQEKRAGRLPAMMEVYKEWVVNNKQARASVSDYLRGNTDDAGFAADLKAKGVALPGADFKFFQEMKAELGERLKPWQLAALRPVQDPFTLATFSVVRQDVMATQAAALKTAANAKFIMSRLELEQKVPNFAQMGWRQVPSDHARFGPYAGRTGPEEAWVHPDAWEAINGAPDFVRDFQRLVTQAMSDDAPLAVRGAMAANNAVRMNRTVYSTSAWLTTTMGNMWSMAKAGVSPWTLFTKGGFGDAIRQWHEFVKSPNAVSIRGKEFTGADWMREGIKYGTIGSDHMTAEFDPIVQSMAKADLLGQIKDYSGLSMVYRKMLAAGLAPKAAFGAIDSLTKHGTWMTMLKAGGVDVRTGNLVDRAAADTMINGSRYRPGSRIDISRMGDEQVVELLKQTTSFRIQRSFAMHNRVGSATAVASSAATISAGTMTNMFVRTAMEEARTDMMLPYRAATEPGVAGALLGWGAVAGAAALLVDRMRSASGLSQRDAADSRDALPAHMRAFAPAPTDLYKFDSKGRIVYLNLDRVFTPLRYTWGDPLGRTVQEQALKAPAQLAGNVLYNMSLGTVFGGTAIEDVGIRPGLAQLGFKMSERNNDPLMPGGSSAMEYVANYTLSPTLRQVYRAYLESQRPGGASLEGGLLKPATGGLVTLGGDPDEAAKRRKMEATYIAGEQDRQDRLRGAAKRAEPEDAKKMQEERTRLKLERARALENK